MNINPLIQEEPRDNTIDILVINICAVVSFFIPFVGFIYFLCFRISDFQRQTPKKKKAISLLLIASIIGLIWQTIIFILIKTKVIPNPFQ